MRKLIILVGICLILLNCGEKSDQLAKEEVLTAMKEIMTITTAVVDYITDHGMAPTQDGIYNEGSDFYKAVCPDYVLSLPTQDPWGNSYLVYCGSTCEGKYGISASGEDEVLVISYGKDGQKETWELDASDEEAGLYYLLEPSDLNKDLINWNGIWIRCPKLD